MSLQNLLTGGPGYVICMGNIGGDLSQENAPEVCTETYKTSFCPYNK